MALTSQCGPPDRDRKRREEKKNTDPAKAKGGAIDDALLEKSEDPHEIMEVYQWPMPLPEDAGRIRAVYPAPGTTHEFWETYEEYFKPVSEEAVRDVLADAIDEDCDDAFRSLLVLVVTCAHPYTQPILPGIVSGVCLCRIPRLGAHWTESKGATREDVHSPDLNDEDMPLKTSSSSRMADIRVYLCSPHTFTHRQPAHLPRLAESCALTSGPSPLTPHPFVPERRDFTLRWTGVPQR